DFTVTVNDADWLKTVRKIEKSVERIKSFRMIGDGRLHVSCYAEPNKLMTCLQEEGKRARLVHWQYGEARTEEYPSTISFTVNVHFDNKDFKDLTMKAGNRAHLVYWQECATNLCLNTGYHPVAIGHRDYKDKARRVESPSFVNYSDNKGNGYNDKSQPCATYMRPSPPRDKPYANKAGICSCCIM
ncbi:hypothetical protein Tco_0554689, partial [Tanacetum coccineum]